jgi:hypothetical protein
MIKVQMVCVVEKRQQKQENNERSLGGGNGNGISVLFFFVDEIGFDTKLSKRCNSAIFPEILETMFFFLFHLFRRMFARHCLSDCNLKSFDCFIFVSEKKCIRQTSRLSTKRQIFH